MSVRLNSVFMQTFVDQLRVENSPKYSQYLKEIEKLENAFIRKDSKGIIDRFYVAGSIKKKSALYYKFDADIIIFFNCEGYEDFIEKMENSYFFEYIKEIVRTEYPISEDNSRKTINSFGFRIDGFQFDILPALNLLCAEDKKRDWSRYFIQHENLIELCHSQKTDYSAVAMNYLRTSYQELNDFFWLMQDGFTRSLILLCKHWCMIHLQELNIYGKKTIIELIAIHVGLTSPPPKCFTNAFFYFLRICADIHNCRISFPEFYSTRRLWPKIDPQQHLLDPANPYYNRLKDSMVKEEHLDEISTKAKDSMETLTYCLENHHLSESRTQLDSIFKFKDHTPFLYYNHELFEPANQAVPTGESLDQDSSQLNPYEMDDETINTDNSEMEQNMEQLNLNSTSPEEANLYPGTFQNTNEQERPSTSQEVSHPKKKVKPTYNLPGHTLGSMLKNTNQITAENVADGPVNKSKRKKKKKKKKSTGEAENLNLRQS